MFHFVCYNPSGMSVCPPFARLFRRVEISGYSSLVTSRPRLVTKSSRYLRSRTPGPRLTMHFNNPSPKSPVDFLQYHRRHKPEFPPLEVYYGFRRTTSQSRTRKARNFRPSDLEVGIREDTLSSYSGAPPYHRYWEEDQCIDRGSGKRREREQPKVGLKTDPRMAYGDGSYIQMRAFDARQWRDKASLPLAQR